MSFDRHIKRILFAFILNLTYSTFAMPSDSVHVKLGAGQDFTPDGTQPGLSFSLESPQICADCHKASSSVGAQFQFLPMSTWEGSMMANATRDPLFWAALDIANNDVPGIGDYCLRCHTPTGWLGGRVVKNGLGGTVDGSNGCLLKGDLIEEDTKNSDFMGVDCHFCHRLDPSGPSGERLVVGSGNVWLDDTNCDQPFGPCRKGPYAYQAADPQAAPHAWERSSYIQDGDYCGSCHNVSSPVLAGGVPLVELLDQGAPTGRAMPLERTYSEWKNSDFGDLIFTDGGGELDNFGQLAISVNNSCQACHMPSIDDLDAAACNINPAGSRVNNMRSHLVVGGSSWMPQVLKNLYGSALGRDEAYDASSAAAIDMLQSKSAQILISDSGSTATNGAFDVRVTNLTGHKLPTGYPEGRRMWIHLEVRDTSDTLIFESGAYDPMSAILSEDSQLKVYEALQGIWDSNANECVIEQNGNKVFHFAQNNCIKKDNRIPPAGFRGGNNIEIQPVAQVYPTVPGNPNQWVNYDITPYQFAIPVSAVFPLTVTATLNYQSASKDYIDFLANEASDNGLQSENDLCNRSDSVGPSEQSRGAFMQQIWTDNGKSAPIDMVMSSIILSEP